MTRVIKRLGDIVASILLMVLLAPIMFVLALMVAAVLGRPVIFRQERAGLAGRRFTLCKFRSMRGIRPGADNSDAARLGRFGHFLRASGLDELPELWNVLRGDMSLVGPRPLLPEYLPLYTPEQSRRHEVRPGITGWAQVHGRNRIDWPERLALDVWYVDHHSILLDLRIIMMTFTQLLRPHQASQEGHATMEPFRGGAPERESTQGGANG